MANRTVAVTFTANTTPYTAGVTKASAATSKFAGAAFGAAARFLGPAGLVMAFTKSAQASIAFDTEITKLSTQIGLTTGEVAELRSAAMSLGGATTKGPQELAEAAFFVASAGLRGADAMDVLRMSARMSAIGLGETRVVADTLTSAINAYGSETLSASRASDVLVSAVRLGKASAEELAGSLGKVLPIASAMGVTFDEVGGIVAAMTRTGTDAATATTQLRAIMTSLLKPTKEAEEAMLGMGLSASGLRSQIADEGLWAALMTLQDATGGNSAEMAKLFPNVRALAGAMDLLGPMLEGNAELMAEMAAAAGVAEEAFATYSLTTRAELDRLGAAFDRTMIGIGDSSTGMIATTTRVFTNILTNIADTIEKSNDAAAFKSRALTDMSTAMSNLISITEGLTGAELEAALASDAYTAALREVDAAAGTLRMTEHELGFVTERRGFLTRDASKFDEERLRLHQLNIDSMLASLDPMRAQNAETERWNAMAGRYNALLGDAAEAQDDFALSAAEAAEELNDQLRIIDLQRDSIRRTVDPMYNLVRSQQDVEKAQADVNRMLTDGTEDGEDLSEAILDLMLKHIDYDAALATTETLMDPFIETLNLMTEDGHLTEAMLDVLIERVAGFGTELDKVDGRVTRSQHIHTTVYETVGTPSSLSPIPQARALGGSVRAGQPYLVGERGPEMMVPMTAGSIVPAGQLARMMGGGGTSGGVVIENYTTMRPVDDDALLTMIEFAQQAGRL
jgi:TP901 family phage tail tape measure protein